MTILRMFSALLRRPGLLLLGVLLLGVLLLGGALCLSFQARAAPDKLNGVHVASISKTFLRSHYSRARFDDAQSAKMLEIFIDRLDPGHYYFLERDVAQFRQYARRLDDLLSRGNIEIAFAVFNRFRLRMNTLAQPIMALLEGDFNLQAGDSITVERKEEPYARDEAEQRRLWAKKLKFEVLRQVLADTAEAEAKNNLKRRYHSFRVQRNRWSHNDVVTVFLNAFTASFDPHSSYLSPDELENFNIALRLSLEGIGATLRWEDGLTVVSSIIAGGAAWKQGSLKQEDKITAVAQGEDGEFEDVRHMRLIDVVKRIRGSRGTTVRLAILRKESAPVESRHEIAIVRDKITLKEGEAKGEVISHPRDKGSSFQLGHIVLPSFYVDFAKRQSHPQNYKRASQDVARILTDFKRKGVDGVILDLRNNGGGGLDEAVTLSGLFLRKGPVVLVKSLRRSISIMRNPFARPYYDGPLVVLVNRYSASASEILAGALKDYGRAVLVGDVSTFGKGTVQNIIQLPDGLGALKTTVAKFYLPGSSSTQHRGVAPHVVFPSLNNHLDLGESSLENAMPWDTIHRVDFLPWADLAPILPLLREHSRIRRQSDPAFSKVRTQVAEYLKEKKGRRRITVSELIAASKKEKKEGKPQALAPPSTEKDFQLQESLNILADVIHFSQGKPFKQAVTSTP